jgi:hypothetical protein
VPGSQKVHPRPSAPAPPLGWLLAFALLLCAAFGLSVGCQNLLCGKKLLGWCWLESSKGASKEAVAQSLPMKSSLQAQAGGHDVRRSTAGSATGADRQVIVRHRSDTFDFVGPATMPAAPPPKPPKPPPKPPRRLSVPSMTEPNVPTYERDVSVELELTDVYK